MRPATEKQQKRLRRSREWQVRNRWLFTGIFSLNIAVQISRIFDKRSQWPFLLKFSVPPGVPIWLSVWENIFAVALFSFVLIAWWVRIHNYQREQFLAAQLALQKNTVPPEGAWPPPPQKV